MSKEQQKRRACLKALELVCSGQLVGLGTGTTVKFFIEALAEMLSLGQLTDIVGVATSSGTIELASRLEIPLLALDELDKKPDIVVDGADQFDLQGRMIKGGGRALTWEKLVAQNCKLWVGVADKSKFVDVLGTNFPLPVEVIKPGHRLALATLQDLATSVTLRREDGRPVETDEGNYIYDCHFNGIPNPEELARTLDSMGGVLNHGLFLGIAHQMIMGTDEDVKIFKFR